MSDDCLDALRYCLGKLNMGCDIHLYAEYRKDGKWHAEQANTIGTTDEWGDIRTDIPESGNTRRNYGLFGLLANVRYDTKHGWDAKGIPDDASKEVRDVITGMEGDGHTHSYLTFQELKEEAAKLLLQSDSDAQEYSRMLPEWINSFGPNPEGVSDEDRRAVFFFDN